MPSPLDVVTGWKFDDFVDPFGSGISVALNVVARDVHKDKADELPVFVADGWRSGFVTYVGQH